MRIQYVGLPTITVKAINTSRKMREELRLTMEKTTTEHHTACCKSWTTEGKNDFRFLSTNITSNFPFHL